MPPAKLTPRQLDCVRLLGAGFTSTMIAHRLDLSIHTVNQYISEACLRLKVRNRTQLVAEAIRLGLI